MPGGTSDSSVACDGVWQNAALYYTGPGASCNVDITVSDVVFSGESSQQLSLYIAQDGTPLVDIVLTDPTAGTYSYPFTLQAAVDSTVVVTMAQSSALSGSVGTYAFRSVALFTELS